MEFSHHPLNSIEHLPPPFLTSYVFLFHLHISIYDSIISMRDTHIMLRPYFDIFVIFFLLWPHQPHHFILFDLFQLRNQKQIKNYPSPVTHYVYVCEFLLIPCWCSLVLPLFTNRFAAVFYSNFKCCFFFFRFFVCFILIFNLFSFF